jgi:hypothetical protein
MKTIITAISLVVSSFALGDALAKVDPEWYLAALIAA